jgi:uncharacterized Zn-finger protein
MTERVSDNLQPQESAAVSAKGFKCPNCGGPVNLELPGKSQVIRCPYCSSVLEPGHDVLVLKEKYNEKFPHKMWIPLGAEGTLEGVKYKCVGMVVRGDDDGGEWCEYLVFNPYHGYRFLVESSGHWTLVEMSPAIGFDGAGRPGWYGPTGKIKIAGKQLRYFTHYKAVVKAIIGEFPWQATIGETNDVTEYINPPYQVSCENVAQYFDKEGNVVELPKSAPQAPKKGKFSFNDTAAGNEDDDEEDDDDGEEEVQQPIASHVNPKDLTRRITESNWSVGEYKYPEEIQAAFNLPEMPPRVGFGMCEPNPAKKRFLFSLAWAALLSLATTVTCTIVAGRAEEKNVLAKTIQLNSADFEYKKQGSTDYLEFNFEPGTIDLPKNTNVEFYVSTPLRQQWISYNIFMINEATGEGYIYDSELSHYWGGSGDDSWSEGSDKTEFTTARMPAGTYYLYVAGATNIGVSDFIRNLKIFGTRPTSQAIPATSPVATPDGSQKPALAKTTAPVAGKTGTSGGFAQTIANARAASGPGGVAALPGQKLLPVDFPGKNSAPKLTLQFRAKRDTASIGSGVLLIFFLMGFSAYYYVRYRMKEGQR